MEAKVSGPYRDGLRMDGQAQWHAGTVLVNQLWAGRLIGQCLPISMVNHHGQLQATSKINLGFGGR